MDNFIIICSSVFVLLVAILIVQSFALIKYIRKVERHDKYLDTLAQELKQQKKPLVEDNPSK